MTNEQTYPTWPTSASGGRITSGCGRYSAWFDDAHVLHLSIDGAEVDNDRFTEATGVDFPARMGAIAADFVERYL